MTDKLLVWFDEVDKDDIHLVGGKGANLGEMVRAGLPVPPGFILTAPAYFHFLDECGLKATISRELQRLNVEDSAHLTRVGRSIQEQILKAPMPREIESDVTRAYATLTRKGRNFVAVRSSATAEDMPGASFAGQQATFLNVRGNRGVVQAVKSCWASLFEPRAIFYRVQMGFDHMRVGIAVPVQRMVMSEVSGVMFTIDPVTNDKHTIVIEAVWGLGELIVQGKVTPDHYVLAKKDLEIVRKEYIEQQVELVWKGKKTLESDVPLKRRFLPKLNDQQVRDLAALGVKLERHYLFPQDIEWALEDKELYIVQTRPVTTIPEGGVKKQDKELDTTKLTLLLAGSPASPRVATGPVRIVHRVADLHRVKRGDVLVTEMTNPDFVPAMRRAAAIVTDRGGRTSHAAIVSRELGIACVVGTETATSVLKQGRIVTVDGRNGKVYQGGVQSIGDDVRAVQAPLLKKHTIFSHKTATKIYVNLAEPEKAWEVSQLNCDGVGLLRAEFMIAEIGIHPKKLIADGKGKYFTDKLAAGLSTFAEAFYPRPVVYRTTDFKTNEYRNLKGGQAFEPEEPNPMLGYRGSYRYIHDPQVFHLELEAITRVRERFNNLWLMIPFVRTVGELKHVKRLVNEAGLSRSASFKLWMMVEIPSNVILLNEFLNVGVDGVSIGSNDLTMLILGTDRDNSEVASEFDERNEAVLWALKRIITTCHDHRVSSSICGQAPSVYPDLTEKLVEWGITSVSVSADAVEHTREVVRATELHLARRSHA